MTISVKAGGRWFGLQADTKPTLGVDQGGHEFYETDGDFIKSIWDPVGLTWVEQV